MAMSFDVVNVRNKAPVGVRRFSTAATCSQKGISWHVDILDALSFFSNHHRDHLLTVTQVNPKLSDLLFVYSRLYIALAVHSGCRQPYFDTPTSRCNLQV